MNELFQFIELFRQNITYKKQDGKWVFVDSKLETEQINVNFITAFTIDAAFITVTVLGEKKKHVFETPYNLDFVKRIANKKLDLEDVAEYRKFFENDPASKYEAVVGNRNTVKIVPKDCPNTSETTA